jgi:N-acetylated-alpha-linked acidic dipeptidase
MKYGKACVALLFASAVNIHPAANDAIRGFDPASQATEVNWEQQARAVPDTTRIRNFIEKLSNRAHMAGTPASKETAEYLLAQLREFGLNAHIEQFEALLPTPHSRSLELVEPEHFTAKLEEPPVPGDRNSSDPGMVPPYNAYSGDGEITAPVVYVNYGVPADYDELSKHGIDVRGKIVIARYGGSWRGIKPKVAHEHGAVGCLIYSDPREDGYFQGDVFPKGAYRPREGVQRGSVMDMVLYPGDPLSPGWASEPGSKRLPLSEAKTLMKIPVIPISYADAQPFLAHLEGPVAPESWRGALPITYHLGPGPAKARLKVSMNNGIHPLYDVIATIPGSEDPDEWVLLGNHHDAWVHGASDPLSGAAPVMETARTLAEMTRKGWKPKRTVMIAFWDGEEFGLVGSTEWMEKHAAELSRKLVTYINSDSNGKGRLGAGGSHSLEQFTQEVARDINDPQSGKPLLTEVLEHSGRNRAAGQSGPQPAGALENASKPEEFRIAPLGSGSDYTPFLQHLGIATLDLRFGGEGGGGVYHSNYDDFYWYSHFSDTTFVYGRTLAQVMTTAVMRLTDAPLLPFEFTRFTDTVNRYLDEIQKIPTTKKAVELSDVRKEVQHLRQTAETLDSDYAKAASKVAAASSAQLEQINRLLYGSERDLTLDPGLPGRPWFRHRIYAPGMYTGYAVKTLPGIREAVEAGRTDEAQQQARQVQQVLQGLDTHLNEADAMLKGL